MEKREGNMKITGAIFDMDGTLINSMDYWAIAASEYLKGLGIDPDPDEDRRYLEMGMKYCCEYYKERYGLDKSYDFMKEKIYSFMNEKYMTVVRLKKGVLDMLKNLKSHGVKMCLATATDRESVQMVLKKLGIEEFFSKIFTASEVGFGKRNPEFFEIVLSYLGTEKETTYVFEDAVYAITTARAAGFKIACVDDRNAFKSKEEMKAMSDIYLSEDNLFKIDLD